MKKVINLLLLSGVIFLTLSTHQVSAQKWGYIDSEFILNKHPDYKIVSDELETLKEAWKKEAQNLERELKEMLSTLKAEEVLLTEEMYEERMSVIEEKRKSTVAFNNRVFGTNGQYYQKQTELLQPLQSKIFDAIDRVAKRNGLAALHDKAASMGLIYTDPRHDYSEFVLEELGIENK